MNKFMHKFNEWMRQTAPIVKEITKDVKNHAKVIFECSDCNEIKISSGLTITRGSIKRKYFGNEAKKQIKRRLN